MLRSILRLFTRTTHTPRPSTSGYDMRTGETYTVATYRIARNTRGRITSTVKVST